ncbi:MAG: response regulator [Cyclobacteriaceae bacterium]|nr:response regulator [Cyclobacteriaceae bacterium]
MNHRILIIEDDFVVATNVSSILKTGGYEVILVCDTGEEAVEFLRKEKVDLAIIDINLAGVLDGIQTANILADRFKVPFIFLTANDTMEAVEKALVTRPAAYLAKPFNPVTLASTVKVALYNKENQSSGHDEQFMFGGTDKDFFFVKTSNKLLKIKYKEVMWVEASDIYCHVKVKDKRYLLGHSLKHVEEVFPPNSFQRIHRSYIVNIHKIDAIETGRIILGTHSIPIGKTYKDTLLKKLSVL